MRLGSILASSETAVCLFGPVMHANQTNLVIVGPSHTRDGPAFV